MSLLFVRSSYFLLCIGFRFWPYSVYTPSKLETKINMMTPDLSVLVSVLAMLEACLDLRPGMITSQLVCTSPNRGKESRVLGSFAKDRCFQETLTKYVRAWYFVLLR